MADIRVYPSREVTPDDIVKLYQTGEYPLAESVDYTVRDMTPVEYAYQTGTVLGHYRVIRWTSAMGRQCECIAFQIWWYPSYTGARYQLRRRHYGTVVYVNIC